MNDRSGWLRQGVRPLLLAAMLAAMGWGLVQLAALLLPEWDGRYIAALLALLVLEAHVSHEFLKRRQLRGGDVLRYRLAEALLLYFVARLLPLILPSGATQWDAARTWLANPELLILNGETWVVYLVMLVFWQGVHATLNDFARIDGNVRETAGRYSLTEVLHDRVALQLSQIESANAHRSLFDRFLQGGVVLLLVTGIRYVSLQALTDFGRAPVTGIFWTVGFYFLCGLMMTGLLRYVTLRRKWQVDRVTVDEGVARGWLTYLAMLLALGVLAALALPTGYSLPLLGTVAGIVEFVFSALAFMGLLLFVIITFPIVWGMWFLSTLFGNESTPPTFRPPTMPPAVAPIAEGFNWWEFARAAGLWLLLIALLWFTVRTYLRDKNLPHRFPRLAVWQARLSAWWASFWAWLASRPGRMAEIVRQQFGGSVTTREGRRVRIRGEANPIIDLYLRLLRRGQARGVLRGKSETPFEYAESINRQFPSAKAGVQRLTDTFVEARYSQHPVTAEMVRESQTAWHEIREALKREEGKE